MKANIKITIERILAYLRQTLTNRERHDLERDVMRDPFDEEAFEGLNQLSADEVEADIHKLNDRMAQRTQKERKWWAHPAFRIAAAIVLLIGLSVVIQVIVKNNFMDTQISEVTEEQTSPVRQDTIQERKEEKATQKTTSKPETDIDDLPEKKQEDKIQEEQEILAELDEGIKENEESAISSREGKTLKRDEKQSGSSELLFSEQVVITGDTDVEPAVKTLRSAKGQQAKSVDQVVVTSKQAHVIRGKVMSKNGAPLIGVHVNEKGTTNDTISNGTGTFELKMRDTSNMLTLSYIGYSTEELVPADIKGDTIVMTEEMIALEEVVVAGNEKRKKPALADVMSEVAPDEPADMEPADMEYDRREAYIGPIPPTETIRQFRKDVQDTLKAKDVEGLEDIRKVVVHFIVYDDGTLGNFEFKNEIDEYLQVEIINAMKAQGTWDPATMDHSSLDTRMRIRLRLR